MPAPSATLLSRSAFTELANDLRRARRTPVSRETRALRGTELVREGLVVAMGEGPAEPGLAGGASTDPGIPLPYSLSHSADRGDGWTARNHRFGVDVHGSTSMTHIDALDHFSWDAMPPILDGSLAELSTGLVSRGVLLDVPALTGRPVEPGHVISLAQVHEAFDRHRVQLRPGDALYVNLGRTGTRRSDLALGAEPVAGLSIECAAWLADAHPSVVVSDAGLDADPSEVEGLPVPWHLLLLTVLGIPLVDMAQLGRLAETCRRLGRWEFLSTIAPLPIPASSGSPVNPLAVF